MGLQLLPLVAFWMIQAITAFIMIVQPLCKTAVAVLDVMYEFPLGD